MKNKCIALLLAVSMMFSEGVISYAAEAQTGKAESSAQTELGTDVYEFKMKCAGDVIDLPMLYDEFTALGWELGKNEDPEEKIPSNAYGMYTFNKGPLSAYVDIVNFGINEAPVTDCVIAGIDVDLSYSEVDLKKEPIELPGGIRVGSSNVEDITAAYGSPSDSYESELYTMLTYKKDIYQSVQLYVFKESNTLLQVEIENYQVPENFNRGSVSTEVPDIVAEYKAPDALGTDYMEPVAEFMGDLYRLPVPVSVFLDNGWIMKEVPEEGFLEGRGMEFIEMMKENQTVQFSVYNMTENATAIENCFITELRFAAYDPEILGLKLSEGITLGADKDALIAKAEERGYQTKTAEDYLTVYCDEDTRLDHYIEFWFNKDEDASKVASITLRNELMN